MAYDVLQKVRVKVLQVIILVDQGKALSPTYCLKLINFHM
jgi:hypothetical protein